jgi:ABC-2 type transport system ATP-binding protein
MEAVVRADGLTKTYRGGARGVSELSFAVACGEVFGLLGPNGAGKTTTIRLLLDLIRPTAGRLSVFGLDSRRDSVAIHSRLGYVPGELQLYDRLTGHELLAYFARLRGLRGLGDAPELAERLDVELDRPLRALSTGNRRKVGLVQAFMHRPELLILDEPTSGLDPLVQETFHELVREAAADGRTVFLSSHVLAEVQELAGRVGLLREGQLVLADSVETLRARAFTRVEVELAQPPPADAFARVDGTRELERRGSTVVLALEGTPDPLIKSLARFEVVRLDVREADLEDVFLRLYRGEPNGAA